MLSNVRETATYNTDLISPWLVYIRILEKTESRVISYYRVISKAMRIYRKFTIQSQGLGRILLKMKEAW